MPPQQALYRIPFFRPRLLTMLKGPTGALHGLIWTCGRGAEGTHREWASGQLTWACLLLGGTGFPHKTLQSFKDPPPHIG